MRSKLTVFALKELRVILRDREALAILFLMPVGFVIIMSLALRDVMRPDGGPQASLVIVDGDRGVLSAAIATALQTYPALDIDIRATGDYPEEVAKVRTQVRRGSIRYALLLEPGLSTRHATQVEQASLTELSAGRSSDRINIPWLTDPTLRGDQRAVARMTLASALARIDLERIRSRIASVPFSAASLEGTSDSFGWLSLSEETSSTVQGSPRPSATQQNVPAYALLAVFMLVVPLSGTLIRERDQGSLARLASMPVPIAVVLGGKLLPWLAINLAQIILCFGVGRFLLPWLGGESLRFGASPGGLILVSLTVSAAAIGFGLLVATIGRTTEQATAFGATVVLLLAAIGGIMVPKLVMPPVLQSMTLLSPPGWALDAYLALLVRDATLADVTPHALALAAFAALCLAIAAHRFVRAVAPT